jgi:hypothetical protein
MPSVKTPTLPLNKTDLIVVIVCSIVGGILLGIALLWISFRVKKRNKTLYKDTDYLDRPTSQDRLTDHKNGPIELGISEFELAGDIRTEMWADPIELSANTSKNMRPEGWI